MAGNRELIEPYSGDTRFVRRAERGQFSVNIDVARSLAQSVRQHAATEGGPGQSDNGGRKR